MADQILINPTPKQQFLADSKKVSAHRNVMQMAPIQEGINMALLEYQRQLTANMTDANAAAAVSFKLKGALEFVNTFLKLGESAPAVEQSKVTQLDHRV